MTQNASQKEKIVNRKEENRLNKKKILHLLTEVLERKNNEADVILK